MSKPRFGKLVPDDFSESMPVTHPLYPRAPYYYRDCKALTFVFETDADLVLSRLPADLELVEPATAVLILAENGFSTVGGAYSECYLNFLCRYQGEEMLYSSNLYETSENAQIIGREIYGFPKKQCKSIAFSTLGSGDVRVTVDLVNEHRLLTAMMRPTERLTLNMHRDLPLIVLKIIPDAEGGQKPSLAQLVKVETTTSVSLGFDGSPDFFAGPGQLHFDQPSELAIPVNKLVSSTMMRFDTLLPYGKILKTY